MLPACSSPLRVSQIAHVAIRAHNEQRSANLQKESGAVNRVRVHSVCATIAEQQPGERSRRRRRRSRHIHRTVAKHGFSAAHH
jgi:hypothetical protein